MLDHQISLNEIESFFKQCLADIGHPLDAPMVFDSPEWQKYPCPHSKHSKTSARYKAFSDGVSNFITQCHRCHESVITFTYKGQKPYKVTPAERQAMHLKAQRQKAAEVEKRTKALVQLKGEWEAAKPCISHPYFDRKNVIISEADGLRLDSQGRIFCPLRLITGELVSAQSIPFKGIKPFYTGPSILEGFHFFGPIEASDEVFFGEGVATCLTIKKCTGKAVVCVYGKRFNVIAPIVAKAYPGKRFIYCCDLPSLGEKVTSKVTSEDNAKKAIAIAGGSIVLPNFLEFPSELDPENERTDFNDLYSLLLASGLSEGDVLTEVGRQLLTNIKDTGMAANLKEVSDKNRDSQKMESNITALKPTIEKADYPELSASSKPLNTYGNLQYMLDRLGIVVRWNDMSRIREAKIPNFPMFYDDEENSALREVINLATINHMPTAKIDDHLTSLAQKNHYHPIVECIKEKPWDGTKRLADFIKTLKTTNDGLSHRLVRRWMVLAVAAAFSEKGIAAQGALVLQGKQNIGKTQWVKSLDPIDCGAVKEGALLDPTNKDSLITLASHWIVELGELDGTFRKADIARIKSHITNQMDEMRFPFARKNSRLSRRTAYIATVNEDQFLVDDTGNRRFWTIEVMSIELAHELDMQQVWAEAYHLWANGEQHWLTKEELILLNESNSKHEPIDPFEEKVLAYFDWCDDWQQWNTTSMTAIRVLEELGYKTDKKADHMRMAKILFKLTGLKPIRTRKGRYYKLPRVRVLKDTTGDT